MRHRFALLGVSPAGLDDDTLEIYIEDCSAGPGARCYATGLVTGEATPEKVAAQAVSTINRLAARDDEEKGL